MTIDTKRFLSSILESLDAIDYVKPEDIPNIPLYMDQVTTFMDSQLASSKRHEDDKILTKTMINNYAKNNRRRRKNTPRNMSWLWFLFTIWKTF